MSDRDIDVAALTLDDEVAVLTAVLDELGLKRVTLRPTRLPLEH
jgi:hypothetical protein